MLRSRLMAALISVAAVCAGQLCLATAVHASLPSAPNAPGAPASNSSGPPAAKPRSFAPEPLTVTIDFLSPAVIPAKGRITVSGRVTNESTDVWTDIGLYPLTSPAPLRTQAELRAALASDPADPVGDRITDFGPLDRIASLQPGQSRSYALRIPRRALNITGEQGVYWFGVQALGAVDGIRDDTAIADGRARTFLSLVDPGTVRRPARHIRVALVLPVRRALTYLPNGQVDDVEGWVRDLAPTGRLGQIVAAGAAAEGRPLTWLVDPAVIDAATALGGRNPSLNLGPYVETPEPAADPDVAADAAAIEPVDPTVDPSPTTSVPPEDEIPTPQDVAQQGATAAQAQVARTWLRDFTRAARTGSVLMLPYGDLDVPAAIASAPETLKDAHEASAAQSLMRQLRALPAIAPLGGSLPVGALGALPDDDLILVAPHNFKPQDGGPAIQGGTAVDVDGRQLFVAPWLPRGPAPGEPLAPVALRQLLLAEAATTLLSGAASSGQSTADSATLILQVPTQWAIADSTGLFDDLDDLGWFELSTVSGALPSSAQVLPAEALAYSPRQAERELTAAAFAAARAVTTAAATARRTLPAGGGTAIRAEHQALTSLSYADRSTPFLARAAADGTARWLGDQLGLVEVSVPESFLVPGESGKFPATVRNGLNQPVLIRLTGESEGAAKVTPIGPFVLKPGEKSTRLLRVRSDALGVHQVTVQVTDSDGVTLNASDPLPVRATARVGRILWVIMGVGGALLFSAIAIRLGRRFWGWRRRM